MSRKVKAVALNSSPFGPFEDAKARFRHQTLVQDYRELHKETEAVRSKLEVMKQRKLTLLAEVGFLRRRHKYLLKNKAAKPHQGQEFVQPKIIESQQKNTKKKNYGRKEAKLRKVAPIVDVNQKERKDSAHRNPSPILDLDEKDRVLTGKEASFRSRTSVFDLNWNERTYGGMDANFRNPIPILDLDQMERFYSRKETSSRNPALSFDLNQMERAYIGREDTAQNRAHLFDLNQISGEEELEDNYEPMRMEEQKTFLVRGGTEEHLNDLKLSICRNVGNGSNRAGKRKISWQDQVALKV
ncbi:uncharacterized protein LOC127806874 [Diospyros lotus]|uniref:uncharacterized protein LOC127806874 n=1 Tax=Diospyros lotus TaxID=55363 RepID=UPI00225B8114|nr:uncharacterized protein LOC127806874 [Diospyros lotus]